MIQALNSAASGIRSGLARLDGAAENVARRSIRTASGQPELTLGMDDGLVTDIVQSLSAKPSVSANAAMFPRADSVRGGLVDLLG